MAGSLHAVIENEFRVRLALPQLQLSLDPRFGSSLPGSRQLLRLDIESRLRDRLTVPDLGPLRDLEQVPLKAAGGFLSISHCEEIGGWLHGPRPLGFDLEIAARVKEKVVARIASAEEVAAAPSAAELWAAKESVFKALAHATQPTVVSQFEIVGWDRGIFRVKEPSKFFSKSIMGCVISQQGFVFSAAVFIP